MNNVFVLSTGRCGSLTFAMACGHMTNYTAGHETRISELGGDRLDYPDNHIEIDNRLSWLAGRLGKRYPRAIYVHLTRDREATARSILAWPAPPSRSILRAYAGGILFGNQTNMRTALDYVDTVNANIDLFGKHMSWYEGKSLLKVRLENAKADFENFWYEIRAEGDLDAALAEWDIKYNSIESALNAVPVLSNKYSTPVYGG
jgi:hypothetical protein